MYKKGRDKAEEAIQETKVRVMMWYDILTLTSRFFFVGFVVYLLTQFFPTLAIWPIFQNLSGCGSKQSISECLANPPRISVEGSLGNETIAGPIYKEMALAAAWGWSLSFDPVLMVYSFIHN
jgi:hypothetical protein